MNPADLAAMANYLNEKSLNGNQVVVRQASTNCMFCLSVLLVQSFTRMLPIMRNSSSNVQCQGDEVQSVIFVRSGSLAMPDA